MRKPRVYVKDGKWCADRNDAPDGVLIEIMFLVTHRNLMEGRL